MSGYQQSLRRSCSACSKSKTRCDLATPRCSRCSKRNVQCLYLNEPAAPSTSSPASSEWRYGEPITSTECTSLSTYRFGSFDPFDSYPQTRLPRDHVQRLIHSFLNKIAFQYYPLDLNASSNPFLISWWPLALGDPALFHVSLSTACLDEELLAQRGFQASDLLMADSVTLLRRKIENQSLAVQDGTMNSIITLAAIEFGKGNTEVSDMHVDGVKKLVHLRGGIGSVRQTSPLTSRMVSWVSMLVSGSPQFGTQDDLGIGDGIPAIPEWQFASPIHDDLSELGSNDIDHAVTNVFLRLRSVFARASRIPLCPTRLHDLACFVIHRLLSMPGTTEYESSPVTECLRQSIILFMFIIQGPTYFSHAVILNSIVTQFMDHIKSLESIHRTTDSFDVWLSSIGMAASAGTANYEWFVQRARETTISLRLNDWEDVFLHIRWILWLESSQGEVIFRPHWDAVTSANQADFSSSEICVLPISEDTTLP